MSMGFIILNGSRVTAFNKGAQDILGYDAQEVLGKKFEEVFPNFLADEKISLKSLLEDSQEKQVELNIYAKNEQKVPVLMNIVPFVWSTGLNSSKIFFIAFQDLREKRKLDEYLLRLDRLRSLGELTAGIVHEIRNPLASISTNVQYINESVDSKFKYYDEIQDILSDIAGIETLIGKMLKFSKPGIPQLLKTNPHNVINEVCKLLKKKFYKGKINIIKNYTEELPAILMDSEQIKQVLFNVLMNACQAMPEGGDLTIKTVYREPCTVNGQRSTVNDSFVEIFIQDTGSGISPDNIGKVFDPFFTTHHEGTGLGLSICQRIIEQHHGTIKVESPPQGSEKGTEFIISLPI